MPTSICQPHAGHFAVSPACFPIAFPQITPIVVQATPECLLSASGSSHPFQPRPSYPLTVVDR